MKIDRNNYEEYFSLYLDNELGKADRLMVEAFLAQNPDLHEELDLASQFRLEPDTELVFPGKTILLKNQELSAEDMLLYLDGELDERMTAKAGKAIAGNDDLRTDFEILKKTKLQPEAIPFPDRSLLYRHEQPVRVISIHWRRIAAALIFLLLAGAVLLILNNRKTGSDGPEIAGNKQVQPSTSPVTTPQVKNQEETTAPSIAEIEVRNTEQQAAVPIARTEQTVVKENDEQKKESPLTNHLHDPEQTNHAIAYADGVQKKTSDPGYDFSNTGVTSVSPQPSNLRTASRSETDYVIADDQEPEGGKNTRLRGFFRKVTRTLEKRTNIDATDEDGRLLVAGLAIKLK
jgi:hypothetical protein